MKKPASKFALIPMTVLLIALLIQGCNYENEEDLYANPTDPDCDTTNVTYSGTVKPILNANCVSCHNENAAKDDVIVSNYPDLISVVENGRFWGAINHEPGFDAMPQGMGKLSACKLRKIKTWIDMGARNN